MPKALYLEPGYATNWSMTKLFLNSPLGLTDESYSIFVSADGTILGHLYTGANNKSQFFATAVGTVKLVLRRNDNIDDNIKRLSYINSDTDQRINFYKSGTIEKHDYVDMEFEANPDPYTTYLKRARVFLPEFFQGVATLYVDNTVIGTEPLLRARTYYDPAYATLACGLGGTRTYTEIATLSDSREWGFKKFFIDQVSIIDTFLPHPRFILPDKVGITDLFELTSLRVSQITDWQFKPQYQVYFDEDGYGTLTQTNWTNRVRSFGVIKKSLTHWSGDFEVGDWSPDFIDEYNELFGSLYENNREGRGKAVSFHALILDNPITFTPQFTGFIRRTSWEDSILSIETKDVIKDLPNRNFVYDYANLGSVVKDKSWGQVKSIIGTMVIFDDFGESKYIERKEKGRSVLESIGYGMIGAAIGGIKGGWVGAGVGFVTGFAANLPTSDRIKGAHYEISDFNAIPDDVVSSGQKLKFFSGSICGIATNIKHPLYGLKEYIVKGGTFRNGIYATLSFADTSGIQIGDYIYSRLPIIYNGSPDEIIRSLLTGSNIDYPYSQDDFFGNWNNEISFLDYYSVGKIIDPTDDSTPFDELKELLGEIQLSFFINELNEFSIRAIRPLDILNTANVATYSQGINILDGFSFTKDTEEAVAGVRIYFNFTGKETGAFKEKYNSMLEIEFPESVPGAKWKEIESKWIYDTDTAKTTICRYKLHSAKGIDRIQIPTTLYGVRQVLTDLIRVSHETGSLTNRLFEIDGYEKSFDTSRVTLQGIDVQRTYGFGNCIWDTHPQDVSVIGTSGYSYQGYNTGTLINIGSLAKVLRSSDNLLLAYAPHDKFANFNNHILGFGTNSNLGVELFMIEEAAGGTLEHPSDYVKIKRGLFNTIRREFPIDTPIYSYGPAAIDQNTKRIKFEGNIATTFRVATTYGINLNLGTAFLFF